MLWSVWSWLNAVKVTEDYSITLRCWIVYLVNGYFLSQHLFFKAKNSGITTLQNPIYNWSQCTERVTTSSFGIQALSTVKASTKIGILGSNLIFWPHVQIWNDLWPIILCNLKTKHRRCIKLYIFGILMTRQTIWHYFSEKSEHTSIFDPCGTLKVNGSHLGNATICGISEKCCLCFVYTLYQISYF